MKLSTLSILVLFLAIGPLSAQQDVVIQCLHNDLDLLRPLHQDDPEALARMAAAEAELEEFTRNFIPPISDRDDADYIIPVVFHIIHNNGAENITNAQVEDAMRVLNEDFRKLNPDWQNVNAAFIDIVADAKVEFRLARKDPQGNCTTGITRTESPLTTSGDQDMKDLIQWPRNKYLNVWVAASAGGAAGYTYRPGSVNDWPSGDGIVLLHNYTGSIGTSAPSRSRTLTHEVGHWLNLAHTWGNTNEPGEAFNCNEDDNVADTPNTIGWTSCNTNGSSCNSPLDNVENYMEYSYCGKMFTSGQATRMTAALNSNTAQRNQLWQSSNLAATGVLEEGTLCAAEFLGMGGVICAGGTISFLDQSFHNVVSRTWEFPGGTPSTSTEPDPVVTYTEAGVFPVTLTVSDGTTSLSTTTNEFVKVLPVPGTVVPFAESFEEINTLEQSEWSVSDLTGSTWEVTNAAAYTGGRSVKMPNGTFNSGNEDELYSGTYDMSAVDNITIGFRYAFARRSSGNDDRLRVYITNNCGDYWSLRKQLRGSMQLSTAPNTTGTFVPSGPDQWGYAYIDNIPSDYHVSGLRLKFVFESDGGNNLYIDDININGFPVGLEEMGVAQEAALTVVPNPAKDNAGLLFTLNEGSDHARIAVLDILGRELDVLHNGSLVKGEHRIELPIGSYSAGIYFVRMERSGVNKVVRFVVE